MQQNAQIMFVILFPKNLNVKIVNIEILRIMHADVSIKLPIRFS